MDKGTIKKLLDSKLFWGTIFLIVAMIMSDSTTYSWLSLARDVFFALAIILLAQSSGDNHERDHKE